MPGRARCALRELRHNLCFPCQINYDFIGKYESLKLDAACTLEVMGTSERITFPDIGKNRKGKDTKTLMKQFCSQIREHDFLRLQETYKMDYSGASALARQRSSIAKEIW